MSSLVFSMAGFKTIGHQEDGSRFLQILENSGGIYVPEVVGDRTEYGPGALDTILSAWTKEPSVLLERKRPYSVEIVMTIDLDRVGTGRDVERSWARTFLSMFVSANHFTSTEKLTELVGLGDRMYDFLSPYYGFIELPWMLKLRGVTLPDRGLPGWGWATWLGPEYEKLIQFPSIDGVTVRPMSDGGRLIVLPTPPDVETPDPSAKEALDDLLKHIDPLVFQPEPSDDLLAPVVKEGVRLPVFRFRPTAPTTRVWDASSFVPETPSRADLSIELRTLIGLALKLATDSARDGPWAPFLVFEGGRGRSLVRFFSPGGAESVIRARDAARSLPRADERYAIAYDGGLTAEGAPSEAVIIEAGERGRTRGVKFAQRFDRKKGRKSFRVIGGVAYVGETEQLLANSQHQTPFNSTPDATTPH